MRKIITIIIGVILIVSVVIPILHATTKEKSDNGWEYDDYIPTSDFPDIDAVSGALELVTIGTQTYVHAKDIGSGEIIYSDGTTEEIYVNKATIDIFVMLGQSNATWLRWDLDTATMIEPGKGYYFGTFDRYGWLEPTNFQMWDLIDTTNGMLRVGDKASSIAKAYYDETGHKSYFLCGAISGCSIIDYDPYKGSSWEYAKSVVSKAISDLDYSKYSIGYCGYYWIQGETDAKMPITEYMDRFLEMNHAINNGELGIKFDHCFISKVRTADGINSSQAQINLSNHYPNLITMATEIADTFTVENGLLDADGIHYSQLGDNLVGTALGTASGEYVKNLDDKNSHQLALDLVGVLPIIVVIGLLLGAGFLIVKRRT